MAQGLPAHGNHAISTSQARQRGSGIFLSSSFQARLVLKFEDTLEVHMPSSVGPRSVSDQGCQTPRDERRNAESKKQDAPPTAHFVFVGIRSTSGAICSHRTDLGFVMSTHDTFLFWESQMFGG